MHFKHAVSTPKQGKSAAAAAERRRLRCPPALFPVALTAALGA